MTYVFRRSGWPAAGLLPAALLLGLLLQAAPAAGELRDPTRPSSPARAAVVDPEPAGQWVLSATLMSPQRRVAVINGQAVGEGESIDGARLLRVFADRAVLRRGGREITLPLTAAGTRFSKTTREETR